MTEAVEKRDKTCENVDFDKAVTLTGYGRFHCELVAASALCMLSVGFQNGLSGYVFPAAQCDLHLSSKEIGLLNVAFLVGGTCSSFIWGAIADVGGRRRVLLITILLDLSTTVICSVTVQNFLGLAACRFFNGFLVGAPASVTYSYLAEFHSPKHRAKSVCYSGVFFTSAWLVLPLLAYLVIPLKIDYELLNFLSLNSWRLFMIILALPELVAFLWLLRLPESPKFYVARGNPRLALMILRKMFAMNTRKDPDEFPVKNLISAVKISTRISDPLKCKKKSFKQIEDMLKQMQSLFKPSLLFLTFLVCTIMFANMFGFFGLGLWLPELFIRFQQFHSQYPNATANIQDLIRLPAQVQNQTCTPTFNGSVFQNTLWLGVFCLLGNIVSGFLAGRLSLRTLTLMTMLFGGSSAASIYYLSSSTQNLIVSCIFFSSMATGNLTLGSVVVELFPTSVSAMAISLTLCAGRLGAICSNMAFGYFLDKQCEIPIFVSAGVILVGCVLCLLIPHQKVNDEHIENKVDIRKSVEISVVENFKYNRDTT